MSDIKLNIQLFGGGGSSEWTAGITESAVNEAFDQFVAQIEKTKETIRDYAKVDEALTAGWSGTDRDVYLELFHAHAEDVCNKIDEYKTAVENQKNDLITEWTSFQAGLIS